MLLPTHIRSPHPTRSLAQSCRHPPLAPWSSSHPLSHMPSTGRNSSVTFTALVLLQHLKVCFIILSSMLLLTRIRSPHPCSLSQGCCHPRLAPWSSPVLYRICPPPDKTTPFSYLHGSRPPSMSEGVFRYSIIYTPSNTHQKPSSPTCLLAQSCCILIWLHSQALILYHIALHRMKLHPSVPFAALVLLQRLKVRFLTARGSSGHRPFISAFILASEVIYHDM